jgi:Cof subfamily protein (haloacid dehalogenase superfamily)
LTDSRVHRLTNLADQPTRPRRCHRSCYVADVPGAGGRSRRSLLVSDLDGTLLRPDATLSETTVRIINDYIVDGGMFTYATARSFTSASRVTAPLDLHLPVITYGGAVVVDPRTREARRAQTLAVEAVDEVLHLTSGSRLLQPIVFAIHEDRDRVCWLTDQATPGVDSFLSKRKGDRRLLPLSDWSTIDKSSVFYISVISSREPLHDLHDGLAEVRARCHVVLTEDVYTPGEWWLVLTSFTGTKAAALTALKSELGADALVCFGDNHNDLPMFAIADTALAVANAVPEVRAAASDVIGANTADGVARWISDHATMPA